LDLSGKQLKSIHSSYGLSAKRIIDFTIYKSQLWLSHTGGVQSIDLNYKQQNIQKPIIRIDAIKINDIKNNISKSNH